MSEGLTAIPTIITEQVPPSRMSLRTLRHMQAYMLLLGLHPATSRRSFLLSPGYPLYGFPRRPRNMRSWAAYLSHAEASAPCPCQACDQSWPRNSSTEKVSES